MANSTVDVRAAQQGDSGIGGTHRDDPIAQLMREQQATEKAVPPTPPVQLAPPKPGVYRFRTKVGYRQMVIPLRLRMEYDDLDKDVKWKKVWERNAKRVHGDDWKQKLKADNDLFDREGIRQILFRPVPNRQEATFETTNPKIAAYIRSRISDPDYIGIVYEEVAPMAVEIDGETVYVIPADPQSRAKMAAAAARE